MKVVRYWVSYINSNVDEEWLYLTKTMGTEVSEVRQGMKTGLHKSQAPGRSVE